MFDVCILIFIIIIGILRDRKVLRLACSSGRAEPTPVHVMSTTSVYEATEVHKLPRVGELELDHWRGIGGGYPQSKWVADKMAQIARYAVCHVRVSCVLRVACVLCVSCG